MVIRSRSGSSPARREARQREERSGVFEQPCQIQRAQVRHQPIRPVPRELIIWYDTGGDGDGSDTGGASGGDVVGVIADQRDGRAAGDPLAIPRLPDGQSCQGGTRGALLGKCPESEVRLETGAV